MDEVKRAAEFNFDARSLASTLEGTKSTRQEGLFPCRAVSSQFPSYLWQLEATPLALPAEVLRPVNIFGQRLRRLQRCPRLPPQPTRASPFLLPSFLICGGRSRCYPGENSFPLTTGARRDSGDHGERPHHRGSNLGTPPSNDAGERSYCSEI